MKVLEERMPCLWQYFNERQCFEGINKIFVNNTKYDTKLYKLTATSQMEIYIFEICTLNISESVIHTLIFEERFCGSLSLRGGP